MAEFAQLAYVSRAVVWQPLRYRHTHLHLRNTLQDRAYRPHSPSPQPELTVIIVPRPRPFFQV